MSSVARKLSNPTFLVILLALCTLLLSILLPYYPELVENLYYRQVYRIFRWFWDHAFGWFPVAWFYFWLLALICFFVIFLRKIFWLKLYKKSFRDLVIFLSLHVIWFYWTWGFNYGRINLAQRWAITSPIKEEDFLKEFYQQTLLIEEFRSTHKFEIENRSFIAAQLEDSIRQLTLQFQKQHGFLAFDKVRCRDLSVQGLLLIWAASGVYLPFTGESQLDGGIHKLSKPFTLAHELCHGMGWTHEGDCNFMAYLICRNSKDPFIRYSGELNYWRYLYANASRVHPEDFKKVRAALSIDVTNDLKEINEANDRFPEIFPKFRSWFYDWYLRNHGIPSGIQSYSEIIRMVMNYKSSSREINR